MGMAEQVEQQIYARTTSSGDSEMDDLLWQKNLEEVKKGHPAGPLEFETLPEDCLVSSRFALMQGDKLRPIDNYSSSLINETVTLSEKPSTVARGKGFKELADLKSVHRQLAVSDASLNFSYYRGLNNYLYYFGGSLI